MARNNLGVSYLEMGEFAAARKEFEHVYRLDPSFGGAVQNLGYIYLETGQIEHAVKLYLDSAGRDSEAADYLEGLAFMYLEGASRPNAERFLLKTAEALCMKRNSCLRAIRTLNRAVENFPDNPFLHLILAKSYESAGDPREALRHLRSARDLGAEIPDDFLDQRTMESEIQ
jgi:Flp pilus assembly protein TadD